MTFEVRNGFEKVKELQSSSMDDDWQKGRFMVITIFKITGNHRVIAN